MSEATQMVVAALPLTALMWFGCYSLGTISYNMLSFRECPEAAAEPIPCAAGSVANVSGLGTCAACEAGSYQSGKGETACERCKLPGCFVCSPGRAWDSLLRAHLPASRLFGQI